jgi:hypothetical protein
MSPLELEEIVAARDFLEGGDEDVTPGDGG